MILFTSILILVLVGIYFYVSIDKAEEEISNVKNRIICNESFYLSKSEYHLKYFSLHNRISKLEKAQKEAHLKMKEDKDVGLPKYRAWVHSFSGMIQVAQIDYKEQKVWGFNRKYFRPDDLALMQSTKFKDTKGKEIYEGDIVLAEEEFYSKHDRKVRVVKFMDGAFRLLYVDERFGVADWHDSTSLTKKEANKMKVVGNIWENPELHHTTLS